MSIFVWTGIDYEHAEKFKALLLWDAVPITLLTGDRDPWRLHVSQIDLPVDAAGVDERLLEFFQDAFICEMDYGRDSGANALACSIIRGLDGYPGLFAPEDFVCVDGAYAWDSLLVAHYARACGAQVFHIQSGLLHGTVEISEHPMVPGEDEPEFITLFRNHRIYGRLDVKNHSVFASNTGNGHPFLQPDEAWAAYRESGRLWDPNRPYDRLVLGQLDSDPSLGLTAEKEFATTKMLCAHLAEQYPAESILYRPERGESYESAKELEQFSNVSFAPARLRDFIGRANKVHALTSPLGAEMQVIGFPVTWHSENWYQELELDIIENRFRFLALAKRFYAAPQNIYDNLWKRVSGQTRDPIVAGRARRAPVHATPRRQVLSTRGR